MSKGKSYYLENIGIVYAVRHKGDVKGSVARNRKIEILLEMRNLGKCIKYLE